jgi:crossover junction endodeoxyribonuclease RuvC
MIILGIDPGTARMGYGVLQIKKGKKPKVLEVDTLVTHQDLSMPKRLKFIYNSLSSIVSKHSPDIMVIEKLFFNTNVKTAIAVGQARGIALLASSDKDIQLFEYTALEAKKVLTGYGRASKQEMQQAVKELLGLDVVVKSDDANDGLAMALCFIKKDLDNLWQIS